MQGQRQTSNEPGAAIAAGMLCCAHGAVCLRGCDRQLINLTSENAISKCHTHSHSMVCLSSLTKILTLGNTKQYTFCGACKSRSERTDGGGMSWFAQELSLQGGPGQTLGVPFFKVVKVIPWGATLPRVDRIAMCGSVLLPPHGHAGFTCGLGLISSLFQVGCGACRIKKVRGSCAVLDFWGCSNAA